MRKWRKEIEEELKHGKTYKMPKSFWKVRRPNNGVSSTCTFLCTCAILTL